MTISSSTLRKARRLAAAAAAAHRADGEAFQQEQQDRWSSVVLAGRDTEQGIFPSSTALNFNTCYTYTAPGGVSSEEAGGVEKEPNNSRPCHTYNSDSGDISALAGLFSEPEGTEDIEAGTVLARLEYDLSEDEEVSLAMAQELAGHGHDEDDDDGSQYQIEDGKMLSSAVTNENTCEGKLSDSKTSKRVFRRVLKVYRFFLDNLESDRNKKLYTSGAPDINRVLVRDFLKFYIDSHKSQSLSQIKDALMFLQRKLSDEMSECGIVCPRGKVREDSWIASFTKKYLVEKATKD